MSTCGSRPRHHWIRTRLPDKWPTIRWFLTVVCAPCWHPVAGTRRPETPPRALSCPRCLPKQGVGTRQGQQRLRGWRTRWRRCRRRWSRHWRSLPATRERIHSGGHLLNRDRGLHCHDERSRHIVDGKNHWCHNGLPVVLVNHRGDGSRLAGEGGHAESATHKVLRRSGGKKRVLSRWQARWQHAL